VKSGSAPFAQSVHVHITAPAIFFLPDDCVRPAHTLGAHRPHATAMMQQTVLLLASCLALLALLLWRERAGRAARRDGERALAALRDSEARFRDFAETGSDWVWETDEVGRYTFISENGLGSLGLRRESFLGRKRADVLAAAVDPEALARHLDDCRERRPFRDVVLWVRHPVGLRCLSIGGKPRFDADGRFRGYRGVSRDVTAETRARDDAATLAAAVDGSQDGVIGTDREGKVVFWNRGAERLYGWTAEEAMGRSIGMLVAPLGASMVEETGRLRACVLRGERVEPFDTTRACKDGSAVRVSVAVTPLRDGAGEIVGALGISRDVSARLSAEDELRRERERSIAFAEAASDWFWESDAELRMTFISARFEAMLGVPLASRLGTVWTDVPGADPEAWRPLLADFAARRPFRDFRFTRAGGDGEIRHVSVSGLPAFGPDGAFLGYRGTGRDMTQEVEARRAVERAETRLRTALEKIAEGFALFDGDDRLVYCNEQYRTLSGAAADLLTPGISFEDYLRAGLSCGEMPEAVGAEEAWLERRLAHHRNPSGPIELMRNGRWLRLQESRLPDGGAILIASDVTDARRREQQLREAQKMEAIGRLTGGVAHDFNNLLAVILGNVEILEERLAADAEARKLARNSMRAALRGAELTQRLLAFARRQPLKPEPTDLNQLVSSVAELLRRTLGAQIAIETRLAPRPVSVLVDPGQLENALLNLAFNARDAMPSGGRLTIATGEADRAPEVEAEGAFATVAVSDTGTGMEPEVAARAFEPFFTTKEPGKGSGLGLSMVYGFARQSSGGVALETQPGRGATVTLFLPRSTAAGDAALEEWQPQRTEGGERVLLVEDSEDVRALARRMLESLGYEVTEAEDAAAALAALERAEGFDLLLTDVMLPGGINGDELARQAQGKRPEIKVLCMSGYSDQGQRLAGSDARLRLLSKPFRRADLARALRETLAS